MLPAGPSAAMAMASGGPSAGGRHTNGTLSGIRGSAYSGESPPPDYNIVVHDSRHGFLSFPYVSHLLSSFFHISISFIFNIS